MTAGRSVTLLGVPFDLGAPDPGCRWGPAALRFAGLADRLRAAGLAVEDGGDVPVGTATGDGIPKNLAAVRETCEALRDRVAAVVRGGGLPVVLGGDHSIAMGAIAGTATALRERGGELGLLWFDAHDDMNTPETGVTGNLHGMPLAVAVGLGESSLVGLAGESPVVAGARVSALGLRVIGAAQTVNIRAAGIGISTRRHFDELGVRTVMDHALERTSLGTQGLHVSFDLDVIDPEFLPGVGSPSPGGLSLTQARLALEQVAQSGRVVSVDCVELNPWFDRRNLSARLAVDLLVALLGGSPP